MHLERGPSLSVHTLRNLLHIYDRDICSTSFSTTVAALLGTEAVAKIEKIFEAIVVVN